MLQQKQTSSKLATQRDTFNNLLGSVSVVHQIFKAFPVHLPKLVKVGEVPLFITEQLM